MLLQGLEADLAEFRTHADQTCDMSQLLDCLSCAG